MTEFAKRHADEKTATCATRRPHDRPRERDGVEEKELSAVSSLISALLAPYSVSQTRILEFFPIVEGAIKKI